MMKGLTQFEERPPLIHDRVKGETVRLDERSDLFRSLQEKAGIIWLKQAEQALGAELSCNKSRKNDILARTLS